MPLPGGLPRELRSPLHRLHADSACAAPVAVGARPGVVGDVSEVTVYRYGARQPASNAALVDEQILLAHRYRNLLTEKMLETVPGRSLSGKAR